MSWYLDTDGPERNACRDVPPQHNMCHHDIRLRFGLWANLIPAYTCMPPMRAFAGVKLFASAGGLRKATELSAEVSWVAFRVSVGQPGKRSWARSVPHGAAPPDYRRTAFFSIRSITESAAPCGTTTAGAE